MRFYFAQLCRCAVGRLGPKIFRFDCILPSGEKIFDFSCHFLKEISKKLEFSSFSRFARVLKFFLPKENFNFLASLASLQDFAPPSVMIMFSFEDGGGIFV